MSFIDPEAYFRGIINVCKNIGLSVEYEDIDQSIHTLFHMGRISKFDMDIINTLSETQKRQLIIQVS